MDLNSKPKPEPIQEDVKENEAEDEEGLTIYPYERLKTTSSDQVTDIDLTKREVCINNTYKLAYIIFRVNYTLTPKVWPDFQKFSTLPAHVFHFQIYTKSDFLSYMRKWC